MLPHCIFPTLGVREMHFTKLLRKSCLVVANSVIHHFIGPPFFPVSLSNRLFTGKHLIRLCFSENPD